MSFITYRKRPVFDLIETNTKKKIKRKVGKEKNAAYGFLLSKIATYLKTYEKIFFFFRFIHSSVVVVVESLMNVTRPKVMIESM